MKALVTGGAGFIGSNLVDMLVNDGHQVIVIDDESSDAHDHFYYNDSVEYWDFDIADYSRIEPLFSGVDYVFHLAAESRIMPSIENPTKAVRTNVLGTCNVLQAARTHGIKRVMYSSTSAAYGLINEPPLNETMPRDCLNPYSVSKCSGEDLCKMYSDLFGLETVIFRYFNVYGERQPVKGPYAPVIGLFKRQLANNEPMTVVGDGLQDRDFVHVKDVCRANIMASFSDNPNIVGETFNIGTGKKYSVLDLVHMIGGEDANYKHIPARPGEAKSTLADTSKALDVFGWQAEINLTEKLLDENKIV